MLQKKANKHDQRIALRKVGQQKAGQAVLLHTDIHVHKSGSLWMTNASSCSSHVRSNANQNGNRLNVTSYRMNIFFLIHILVI